MLFLRGISDVPVLSDGKILSHSMFSFRLIAFTKAYILNAFLQAVFTFY